MRVTIDEKEANKAIAGFSKHLAPYNFAVNDKAEICEVKEEYNAKTGKTTFKIIVLAHFLPYLISQTRIVERNGNTLLYRIEAITWDRSTSQFIKLETLEVASADLEEMRWISKWGADATILPVHSYREKVRYCIQLLGQMAVRDEVVAEIGWCNGNFLHAGGSIGPDEVKVEAPESVAKYELPKEVKNPRKAVTYSLAALEVASHHLTYSLLALMFLAPIMRFFEEKAKITAKFVLWVCGDSGLQKTTIVSLFLCHFGKFSDGVAPASFDATPNGLERTLYDGKDVVTLVDDYFPSAAGSEGERMTKVAQKILRSVGDRRGKPRMQSNLKQSPSFPPRGQVVVTAEDLPPAGKSTYARFLCVNVEAKDRDKEKLAEAMKRPLALARSMRAYIEYILVNQKTFEEADLLVQFHELRAEYAAKDNHDRIAEALAWLDIGFSFFLQFALSHQAITEEKASAMRAEAKEVFAAIGKQQQAIIRNSNPVDQFLESVGTMLRAKTIKVFERNPVLLGNPNAVSSKDWRENAREWVADEKHAGYVDDQNCFFIPDTIYAAYKRQCEEMGFRTIMTKSVLFKRLRESGKIISEGSGTASPHSCPHVVIRGKKQRFLVIPKRFLDGDEDAALATEEEFVAHEAEMAAEQQKCQDSKLIRMDARKKAAGNR